MMLKYKFVPKKSMSQCTKKCKYTKKNDRNDF